MKTLKIFANYGCLAAEKRIVYTHGLPEATAVTSEEIEVELPQNFNVYEGKMGDLCVEYPDKSTYLLNDVLNSRNDVPVLLLPGSEGAVPMKKV